jgi:hypothetical protein
MNLSTFSLLCCISVSLSLTQVHGTITFTSILGTTLSAAGGIVYFEGSGFTTVGPMLCAIIPTHNHAMNIISDILMSCVIQDEGSMGSYYPLYVANSTVILLSLTNEIYYTTNYPDITSLGTEYYLDSSTLTNWLPNCAINGGNYLVYYGNYIPNAPTLYRYMELKSSSGYSYAVSYESSIPFYPQSPSPALVIEYDANTIATSAVWADMYLAWGTGGSYTKVTAALQLCDDGINCVRRSSTNYCFLKSFDESRGVLNTTTYYDASPSMKYKDVSLNLKDLKVLTKHPVKLFSSVNRDNASKYVNSHVLCHDVACI